MSQSLQKTWGLQNCKIELKDPVIGTLSPGLAISLMDFREKPVFPPLHLGVGCSVVDAGALSLERTFAFVEDTKIFQNGVVVYDFNGKCEEKTPDSGAGSCLISSGTLALEDNPMFVGDTKIFQDALAVDASNGQCEEKTPLEVQDSKQDDAHENPSIFNLSFSIAGSDIGGKCV